MIDLYEYEAEVLRVVDGDTLQLKVDLGFHTFLDVRVRLLGVDTPEVYGVKHSSEEYQRGVQASTFTKDWVRENGYTELTWGLDGEFTHKYIVMIRTHKNATDKYGRWLAEIFPPEGGTSLNEALLAAGHNEEG